MGYARGKKSVRKAKKSAPLGRLWWIIDPVGLAGLLSEQATAEGGVNELVSQLGLSRMGLWRLRNGERKAVTASTFRKLLRSVAQDQRQAMADAFLSPEGRERCERYDDWVGQARRAALGLFTAPDTLPDIELAPGAPSAPVWKAAPDGMRYDARPRVAGRRLPSALKAIAASNGSAEDDGIVDVSGIEEDPHVSLPHHPPLARDVLESVKGLPGYESYFVGFRQRVPGRGPEWEARLELAELTAVAPLAVAGVSGGIERSAWELHAAGELGPYLKAALRAQELLLKREPAILRAQAERPIPCRDKPLGKPGELGRAAETRQRMEKMLRKQGGMATRGTQRI